MKDKEKLSDNEQQQMFTQATHYALKAGYLEGILIGIRIGIDPERAKIIDAALSDTRYFKE